MNLEKIIDNVYQLKELNEILLDKNYNLLLRLIKQSREKDISIDLETLSLVAEVRKTLGLIYSLSPTFQHPSTTPDDSTEPKILM